MTPAAPAPAPVLAPAPKRVPDFAFIIAANLISEYDKKRAVAPHLPKLSSAARLVLLAVAKFAWKRDEQDHRYRCRPGIHGDLQRFTGLDPDRTIPKAIAQLETAGLLKVTRRYDAKRRRNLSHLYELIESPDAYAVVAERRAAGAAPKPPRAPRTAYPATVEELTAARHLQAEYHALYPTLRYGVPYIPDKRDEAAALAIVRAYPDAEYRSALMRAWADPSTLKDTPPPPAHQARLIMHAPQYLAIIDGYWQSIGQGPGA